MSSKSRKKGNGAGRPVSPQDKLQAPPPQQVTTPTGEKRPERQFIIGEVAMQEILQYVQQAPTGNMPGGAAIKVFVTIQQLPELEPDGEGAFHLKAPPQLNLPQMAAAQAEESDG